MVEVIEFEQLGESQLSEWTELLGARQEFHNGFLAPQFAAAVNRVRGGVEVAIINDGEAVGYLPLERGRMRVVSGCGISLGDAQGLVGNVHPSWLPKLLDHVNADVMEFDHLLANQCPPGVRARIDDAPIIELSEGYEAYDHWIHQTHKSRIKGYDRKENKLVREHGDFHFRFRDDRQSTLKALGSWKSAQYKRSGYHDLFADKWYRDLLGELLATKPTKEFSVFMSSLSIEDRVIAAQINVASHGTISCWVTGFDRDFSKYSPGIVLLRQALREGAEEGFTRYEFGKGDESFKQDMKTGDAKVATVWFAKPGAAAALFWLKREPRRRVERFILDRPQLRSRVRTAVSALGRFRP